MAEENRDGAAAGGAGGGTEERGRVRPIRRRHVSWKRSALEAERELAKAQEEREALQDRFLRQAAEFENYRRRTEEERRTLREEAKALALADQLPIVDLLAMALAAAEQGCSLDDLTQGLRLVEANWMSLLAGAGLAPVECAGQPFDPLLHEAVQTRIVEDLPPGRVVQEVRRGYTLRGRLLRPARVVVSAAPPAPEAAPGQDGPAPPEHSIEPGK